MKPKFCETCANFVQHYRKDVYCGEIRFTPVGCGHCTKRRPKRYPPETPACELWQPCGGGVTE